MSDAPLISVVIPTYNRGQKTITAIHSVLAQTHQKLEIIVVDDGSKDNSREVIQQFLKQKPEGSGGLREIRYYEQPNQGPSAARNTGIEKARGEYIAFLDSDDDWLPEKLEWQLRTIEKFKSECGACYTDAEMVNGPGDSISSFAHHGRHYEQVEGIEPDAVKYLVKAFGGYWLSSFLGRTDLIRQIGAFDPDIHFAEDSDFYFRISQATHLAYINKLLTHVDRTTQPNDSDCRTWHQIEVRLRGQQDLLEKWLRTGTKMPAEVRKATEQYLRKIYSQWTNWYLETGKYDEARRAAFQAVHYDATFGVTVKWAMTWVAPAWARKITAKAPAYL